MSAGIEIVVAEVSWWGALAGSHSNVFRIDAQLRVKGAATHSEALRILEDRLREQGGSA